jgi:hypothetical protein
MIRTEVTAKEKLKREQSLKIYPKTGAVRSVVPAPKVLSAWVENKTRPYSAKQRRIMGVFKFWFPQSL